MKRWSGVLGLLAGTAVLAAALALACRGLILGTAVGKWDVEAAYAHEFTLLADFARAFQLPLWNPLSNGGAPEYLRDTGNASPLNLLLAFLIGGELLSFWKYWLAFWLLGGVGMLCLARHLGAPLWGGLVVALGFLFSGFYTGHGSHTSYVVSASFLPWIVWRADVALRERSVRAALETGALWGLGALSGYPAFAILNGCFVAAWALVRVLAPEPLPAATRSAPPPSWGARIAWASVACTLVLLVGVAVLAPTYAGMLVEGAGYTDRSGAVPRDVALLSNALPPGALSTLASPCIALFKYDDDTLWSRCDVTMCSLYCGVLVPALACTALALRPGARFRWGVLALGLACLAAAMGADLPVRGWLYDALPPTRYFRHPAIFRLYGIFALCVLALCATRDLATEDGARRARLRFLGSSVGLAVAALVAFETAGAHLPAGPPAGAHLALLLLWGGGALLGACAVLVPGAWTSSSSALWPWLLVALAFGDALHSGACSERVLFETDPAGPRSWREIDARHDPSLDWTAKGLTRMPFVKAAEHYGTLHNGGYESKTPTLFNYGPLANHLHQPLPTASASALTACAPWIQQAVLANSTLGPSRIWFAERALEVPPANDAFAAFSARSAELGTPPLVLHSRASLLATDATAPSPPDALAALRELPPVRRLAGTLEEYTPRRLALTVNAPAAGWVWVTDRWARGWSARVNGREAEVLGGNFLFRAVAVPAGPCEIVFEYRPFGFPWLWVLSWTALASVGAASLWSRVRRRRAPDPLGMLAG